MAAQPTPKKLRLTSKQEKFVQEYMIDLHATNAALRAGYSPKTARRVGSLMLRTPHIQEAIQAHKKKRQKRTEIKADQVLREAAKLAFCDIRQVYNPKDFEMVPPSELPDDVAAAVSGIEKKVKVYDNETELVTYKYTFWDKNRALEKLFRHLGLYEADKQDTQKIVVEVLGAEKSKFQVIVDE
jgi:phage terminase small subunit